MTTEDVRIEDWVVHRPNVVRSVAARVPGVDAEEAASRALEKMIRIVSAGGTINDPAPYWRRAAVNEAITLTRETGRTRPVEDDTLDGLVPPVAGTELDAERQADVAMLRSALSGLADDDRALLLDRHVHDRAVNAIAGDLGVRPHAVTMRLRRAEERLAGAFAAAHTHDVSQPDCRTTRAAMHDYIKGRLLPRRQRFLEVHMDGCAECTRAFIDVREVSWMLRDLGQHVVAGGLISGAAGGAAGAGLAGAAAALRPRSIGTKQAAVATGVLAALVLGGGAAALIAGQGTPPSIQAFGDPGGASGGGDAGTFAKPSQPDDEAPTTPQDAPEPRPATTPADDVAPVSEPVSRPVPLPEPDVAVPAPAPEPDAAPQPPAVEPAPAEQPAAAPPEQEAPAPVAPAPAPAPAPEPEPAPTPPPPPPPPPPPVAPEPPSETSPGGPPGNPGNTHGKGPTKEKERGPDKDNGKGSGKTKDKGPGHDNGKGSGANKG